jgi:NAD(P)-dependent dehydrogenase (short-subunit alcohol dehydrogenase family)
LKLALVTAGFHRLGAAIAARLAEEGWTLALHGRRPETPDTSLSAMLALHKSEWHGFVADLADSDDVQHLIPAVEAHFGKAPDLLVNNASQFEWDDTSSVTQASLNAHFNVNAGAPVALATSLASHVGDEATAAVVNILDQRIRHPSGDQLSYTISKLALFGATETLARALAPKVRVNAVAPGLVIPTDEYLPSQMEALRAAMPLGRLPEPDDIADAVLWLSAAEVVTGQTIFVDGGAALKSFERDFLFLGRDG